MGNGTQTTSGVTVGHVATFSDVFGNIKDGGPLPSGGGSGTVTSASVVSANGLAGTVANPTTTPAITLGTTITGLLKGNSTAISAATAGTDYQGPIALTTTGSSGVATFIGNTLNVPNYSAAGGPAYIASSGTATAGGSNSLAIGPSASAGGNDSVAVGLSSSSGGVNATALGEGANAAGANDVCLGSSVSTAGNTGGTTNTLLGHGSNLGGTGVSHATAIGGGGVNSSNGIAIGYGTSVGNGDSIVISTSEAADQASGDIVLQTTESTLAIKNNKLVLAASAITTAPASGVLTLTNAPAGATGNPAVYLTMTVNGTSYIFPGWAP